VIAEAWASGIPVISTPVGIAAEMSEEAGILVKDNDPLSLAMAMEKIINDLPFDPVTIRKEALKYTEQAFLHSISEIYYATL
jgi:glycosyltransferase involved in cell wall biosynthesis